MKTRVKLKKLENLKFWPRDLVGLTWYGHQSCSEDFSSLQEQEWLPCAYRAQG